MALTLYVGPPGSGKTYEAVAAVLIPAYQAGRHIVTNIKGIDPEYWADNLEPAKGSALGSIKVVPEDFFLVDENYPLMSKDGTNLEAGAIPPGAIVCIDEAYLVFPTGRDNGVTKRMIEYVRTHRHLVDDGGIASDIIMITQDVASLAPGVRSVSEFVVAVRNLRYASLGARYRTVTYTSAKMTAASQMGIAVKKYKKSVFNFYKSFQFDGAAKVVLTDKSHRLFKWWHGVALILTVALLGYGLSGVGRTYANIKGEHPGTSLAVNAKPECAGSGVLVDLTDRRAFYHGEWRKLDAITTGPDGRSRWDVGPCIVTFSA